MKIGYVRTSKKEQNIREVCEAVGVSRSTLYRHLKPNGTAR
jgi:predicted DNA-binding transcriptional regulator AlpA